MRGLCTRVPAQLNQMVTDGQATIDQLAAYDQPTDEFETAVAAGIVASDLIASGCASVLSLIDELIAVFVPALMCVIAIVFAAVVNETLCCAAGCCKGPPKESSLNHVQPKEKEQDVLQAV